MVIGSPRHSWAGQGQQRSRVARVMKQAFLPNAVVLVVASLCVSCGAVTSAPKNDRQMDQIKVVGVLYGQFMSANRGSPPTNQDQFIAFMQREPENWNKIAATPQEL